jgi:hypothetical protein
VAAERAGVAHAAHQVVTWVSWGGQLRGYRARGGPGARGRCPGVEGLMRALGGVFAAEAIEERPGLSRRAGGFLLSGIAYSPQMPLARIPW